MRPFNVLVLHLGAFVQFPVKLILLVCRLWNSCV